MDGARHSSARPLGHLADIVLGCFVLISMFSNSLFAQSGPGQSEDLLSELSFADVLALPARSPDMRIQYAASALQFGDLWLPVRESAVASAAPLVVLVHGGCWLNAFAVEHTWPMAAALAQTGVAVWSLEYRRVGDEGGGWPGSLDDIDTALARLDLLAGYGIDLGRVVLVGHSAGGHLALLASQRGVDAVAVIGLAAITDITRYAAGTNTCQQAAPQFMGGTPADKPTEYSLANPADRNPHPATILFYGDADVIVPPEQARLNGAEAVFVAGAGHFDWIHPGSRAFRAFLTRLHQEFAP
jgi:acetyl esterase/lipase